MARTAPSSARCSTVTPSAAMRWKARLRVSSVGHSEGVSLRKASSMAEAGRRGFSSARASRRRCSKRPHHSQCDVGAVGHAPADASQPVEGGGFDIGFGERAGVIKVFSSIWTLDAVRNERFEVLKGLQTLLGSLAKDAALYERGSIVCLGYRFPDFCQYVLLIFPPIEKCSQWNPILLGVCYDNQTQERSESRAYQK